jgi:hypothetical protein
VRHVPVLQLTFSQVAQEKAGTLSHFELAGRRAPKSRRKVSARLMKRIPFISRIFRLPPSSRESSPESL